MRTTLYSMGSSGLRVWVVQANGPFLSTYAGTPDGVRLVSNKICEAKNVGRANETTPEAQAKKEAEALVRDALKKQWAYTVEEAAKKRETCDNVMLASNVKDHPEYVVYPMAGQFKLNGMRCDSLLGPEITAKSRKNNAIILHEKLASELFIVRDAALQLHLDTVLRLDGELYKHGWPLGTIISAVKNQKNPKHSQLEYHVYDMIADIEQEERLRILSALEDMTRGQLEFVKFCDYKYIRNSEEHRQFFQSAKNQRYEGIMLRELCAPYYHSKTESDRPPCLIKDKGDMDDAEFEVVAVEEDVTGGGTVVCKAENGETFRCRLEGAEARRVDVLVNKEKYIGKLLTVRFFGRSQYGIPQNPVGEEFRDYE